MFYNQSLTGELQEPGLLIGARFFSVFQTGKLIFSHGATEIIRKQILDLRIKSRLLNPIKRNAVYAYLKYPSSAIFK